jgi:pimeloyl-ACP methyl ester carboxylesterase
MKKTKKNNRKNIFKIIYIVLVLILCIFTWNKLQEYIFFHPWNDMIAHNKLKDINEFKEINIKNDEVNLNGWLWNIQNKKAPLVIFFTGNAQNSSNTLLYYYESDNMKNVFGDYNLMIVDYPGYGISKGKPSDDSMFVASKYIFEYASNMDEVDKDNIVIMGYSIGTGVASYCASVSDANGLILVAPYDKALSLYNDAIDSFHGSVASLAKYSFDSAKYAESVSEPTLIFTSKSDEVINYSHSLDLAGHFSELDDVVILEGVNHNGYFSNDEVLNGITSFLNKVKK